jgi:hypothetical protein
MERSRDVLALLLALIAFSGKQGKWTQSVQCQDQSLASKHKTSQAFSFFSCPDGCHVIRLALHFEEIEE